MPPGARPTASPWSPLAVAHHVQKKATRHHHDSRPRKSRLSDINRKVPEYPAPVDDVPWMIKTEKTATAVSDGVRTWVP